jgi:SAM-dependent methyltransferase
MYQQKWKSDKELYDAPREDDKKTLDYYGTYVKEFLDADPIRDWESIARCIKLWDFFIDLPDVKLPKKCSVLDCGTKDGQFPEYLVGKGYDTLGIEISKPYVEYAQGRGRPVEYGDVCNLELITDRSYNVAFAHHLLGLVPDYSTAYAEMIRVVKAGGYIVTLDNIPGNPRKHYQIVETQERLMEIIQNAMVQFDEVIEILFFDRFPFRDEHGDEFLVVLQRTRRKKK